ncbi:MAG: hypothetical protein R3C17_12335 [Planctomycetaceae bacterium]
MLTGKMLRAALQLLTNEPKWLEQKETVAMTYNMIGRYIASVIRVSCESDSFRVSQ